MNTSNNNPNEMSDTGTAEFDAIVELLRADAAAHAAAADAGLEQRIAATTLPTRVRHQPALRLVGAEESAAHRQVAGGSTRGATRGSSWAGGLRVAAGVALLATVSAAFLASRPVSAPTTTTSVASTASVVEDWDLLLGSDTTTSPLSSGLASASATLLKESESIGTRWSSEDSGSDWTMLEDSQNEGSL
ncbi:MAG: hypothetical protein SFY96_12380 [Planctomycetota bacterium]|nr:hypothetical protein [Planctomycetota bacterium]